MRRYNRYFFQPCLPLGKNGERVTGSREHISLSRFAAGEGMVLLKNNNGVLPLKKGVKVAAFGQASINYIKGGTGSGDVCCEYVRNIYDGLEEKQEQGFLTFFKPLKDLYAEYLKNAENPVEECQIPDDVFAEAVDFADVALVSICRNSGEGKDRAAIKGDYYLSESEEALVNRVKGSFKNVVVILNVGGMVDTNWFIEDDGIQSVLLAWQGGMEGALATVDILTGDVNPSGKLTDTFAKSFDDYPSSAGFNECDNYVDYTDDIYVGYRYFETIPGADKSVNYPFGFGLSYTTFKLDDINVNEKDGEITVILKVTNTGAIAGKEVVQVYFEAPSGKLGKPKKQLIAFAKTKLLKPNEVQEVILSFKAEDMASFDDLGKVQKSAYILEKGDYRVHIGTSVRETAMADFVYSVDADKIVKQLKSYCKPVALKHRMLSDGSFEQLPLGEVKREYPENKEIKADLPPSKLAFYDITSADMLDIFIQQFSVDEMCEFLGGSPDIGVSNTACFAGLKRLGIPAMPTADGPAGLRIESYVGVYTTAWPCATLIACSWDIELMQKIGACGGLELKENNLAFWLTPGLNIHRSPLCGRNFEYFSEDPVVSGEMAAAMVKGMQSVGTGCSIKHFVCNNKERGRAISDSRVSERALREIYLKGFEICVKKANPWSVMTSYNLINGIHTSENYELIGGILRGEWGFKGMVTTDWDIKNSPVLEVKAGNDMKMHIGYPQDLKAAYDQGELTKGDLQACIKRILTVYLNFE